jgi:hypothetical protein
MAATVVAVMADAMADAATVKAPQRSTNHLAI